MSLLFLVLSSQVLVIGFIAIILKGVLNNMLLDLAVRHIDVWKLSETENVDRIVVYTHKVLKQSRMDEFNKVSQRVFSSAIALDFRVQKFILGGAIVHVGKKIIDCSLKDRLKQAFRG